MSAAIAAAVCRFCGLTASPGNTLCYDCNETTAGGQFCRDIYCRARRVESDKRDGYCKKHREEAEAEKRALAKDVEFENRTGLYQLTAYEIRKFEEDKRRFGIDEANKRAADRENWRDRIAGKAGI